MSKVEVIIANESHFKFATQICKVIESSAKDRGTGIAKRTPEYIEKKMSAGNAVIALEGDEFAGFCYIEAWSHGKYVAHSGLIVHPNFRKQGLAKRIKEFIFNYSLKKYPEAKIFGITTGLAVMKINSKLGYKPVTFSELTDDPKFWAGCKTCTNFEILKSKDYKMCMCTGMLYNPNDNDDSHFELNKDNWFKEKVIKRLKRIKHLMLKQ
ncbi:GNAT family N-acetyltransferase [Aquimarina agarivorans]|uniref:GNAT family N-acetyltransferase n=1 Tax=Aquimarina agarivorans TaxID=980584 RepID=UPI000248EA9C|nr:GNAT family N-acetyltransferase [Aquimarina agarivorans]